MNFKEWILSLFKDERGQISVKPVIAIMGSLALCLSMLFTTYLHIELIQNPAYVDSVTYITIAGMGADTLDKFSNRPKASKDSTEQPS